MIIQIISYFDFQMLIPAVKALKNYGFI